MMRSKRRATAAAMRSPRLLGIVLFFTPWLAGPALAQQSPAPASELEQLKAQIQQIEARIEALEKSEKAEQAKAATAAPAAAPSEPAQPAGPDAVQQAAAAGMDTMDAGMGGETIKIPIIPAIKIRGFGDVRGFVANQNLAVINPNNPGATTLPYQGGETTFALGIMDLFVTSKISEHFSYLTEIGFEADPLDNNMGVDLERAQLSYMRSDKFSLSVGRSHAMLGYYNTAFHHGTWFQTTIDRPHMFEFEDSGGPLPIHNVGLAAMGKIPSGKLGLHWLAEVGNGKQTYSLAAGVTPANVLADHTGKSTNIGLLARPDRFPGLQFGFDWYQASLVPAVSLLPGYGEVGFAFPNAASYYHQNIFVAHALYITPSFEFMLEQAQMEDTPRGSNTALSTSGGYAQLSRAFKSYRPYVRFQWLNPNFRDPNTAWSGHWVGPNVGMRYDINTFIALKAEFSRYDWKDFSTDASGNQILPILHKTIEQFGSQITYTF